jgi:transcriptional regulator with XRE-family HTH domain
MENSPFYDDMPVLLTTLKRVYKLARIRYADAAAVLGVSEMTVKRAMAGKGLSAAMLQRLCSAANIGLIELAELAKETIATRRPAATSAQTEAVIADPMIGMVYFLLANGWRPERIRVECDLDEIGLTRCLVQLDRIGVITLFPGNRVRLLRQMNPEIRDSVAAFELLARRIHRFFDQPDLSDPHLAWSGGVARLSPASFRIIQQRLDRLRDEAFALGERDFALPVDDVRWYVLFAAAKPVSMQELVSD